MHRTNEELLEYWLEEIRQKWITRPGQHLMEVGIPGTGKTQGLVFLLEGITIHTKNCIVWFDSCKTSEFLILARFRPLQVLIPEGMTIEIKNLKEPLDIVVKEVPLDQLEDPWEYLDRDRINVVSFEPYIIDPDIFVPLMARIFTKLIRKAHRYEIIVPLEIFFDEFHRIVPAKGQALSEIQSRFGATIQHNVERLRSFKIRFIVSSQGYNKIRKGVKQAFNFLLIRRGTYIESGKLKNYNNLFEKLHTDKAIFVFEDKKFTDKLNLPFYGDGESLGDVRYYGELSKLKGEKHLPGTKFGAEEDAPVESLAAVEGEIANLEKWIEKLEADLNGSTDPEIRSYLQQEIDRSDRDMEVLEARRAALEEE